MLTGGTGLYIRAFLEGLLPSGEADPDLLRESSSVPTTSAVAEGDPLRLHRQLAELDPRGGEEAIHPNDVRASCAPSRSHASVGKTGSEVRADHAFGDRPFARCT